MRAVLEAIRTWYRRRMRERLVRWRARGERDIYYKPVQCVLCHKRLYTMDEILRHTTPADPCTPRPELRGFTVERGGVLRFDRDTGERL